jgi:hypothetical protein
MIFVILTGYRIRQPGDDDFWPGDADQADNFVQGQAVVPIVEGAENILTGRVVAAEEPDILNSQGGECAPGFQHSELPKGRTSFVPNLVSTAVAAGAVDDRNAFVLVERNAGKEAADEHIVVRMGDNNKYIGFVAGIGLEQSRCYGFGGSRLSRREVPEQNAADDWDQSFHLDTVHFRFFEIAVNQ